MVIGREMKNKKNVFLLTSLFSFLLLAQIFTASVLGQGTTTETIDATVRISVCGDGVAEAPEDCDGSDLDGGTCITLGYTGGTLSCDIACDFNTLSCTNIPVSPDQDEDDNADDDDSSDESSETSTTSEDTIVTSPITHIPPNIPSAPLIPLALNFFDSDKNGKIETAEVFAAVESWVEIWKETLIEEIPKPEGKSFEKEEVKRCDINNDTKCNIVDLSILLFYVQK